MTAVVRVEGNKIVIQCPYDALFVETIKKAFTDSERTYDEATKQWIIDYTDENYQLARKLVQEHFYNTEEKLVVFKCNGDTPRVNSMPLIKYTRDDDRKSKAWCFDVIVYKRMGSRGSRKYPNFEGIVLAKVLVNGNTKIEAAEYKVYTYSKMLQMTAIELVENAESIDDFEKICEALDKQAQKLSGYVEVGKEAVIVKGFLVLSSLPSKALLDKALPEEFKNTRIGTKFVKVVSGYFYNKLGTLSRKFYTSILEKYAVNAGFGYIVPAHKVQDFIAEIEQLRKEYERFERELREFIEEGKVPEKISDRAKVEPEYLELIREYLREHGINEIKVPNISERVKIRLIPFSVDMSFIEEHIEKQTIEKVQRELEMVKREMIENVRKQLEEKIQSILERLKNYEKTRMSKTVVKKLKEDIEWVIKTSEDLGVEMDRRVSALKETIDEIENIESGRRIEVSEAEGRVKALLKELGISN